MSKEFLLLIWSIAGSIALGVVLGYILALWGKRVKEHGEILILVMGMILIAVGHRTGSDYHLLTKYALSRAGETRVEDLGAFEEI